MSVVKGRIKGTFEILQTLQKQFRWYVGLVYVEEQQVYLDYWKNPMIIVVDLNAGAVCKHGGLV